MSRVEWMTIPGGSLPIAVAVVAATFLVSAWMKFRNERFALPEWRRSFGFVALSLSAIAWSVFVACFVLIWTEGIDTRHVTLDVTKQGYAAAVGGDCLMISLFSVVGVFFLKGSCRTLAVLAALLTLLLWVGDCVVAEPSSRWGNAGNSLIRNQQRIASGSAYLRNLETLKL